MISRFITEIKASFNPFSPRAKSLLPRTTSEPDALLVKFKDGKEMKLDCDMGIKGVIEEIDRHSRVLQKQADLSDG
ncbi:hypothetical protein P8C59_007077 [Phyllachora maydis]|uniref:Mitochondrial ribosomal protein L44 n=1 Tax=Phyllachora maydis TaxID=1825666 RepID=A0AAD9I8X4_9PEZI|nr:hypothetical protein P8C59_007077 [Phyllachora maydis]